MLSTYNNITVKSYGVDSFLFSIVEFATAFLNDLPNQIECFFAKNFKSSKLKYPNNKDRMNNNMSN